MNRSSFNQPAAFLSRPQLYGGFGGFPRDGEKDRLVVARGQRQRLNVVSVCQCLFLPWLMFCFTYGVCSFSLHYNNLRLMYTLLGVSLLLVLVSGGLAVGVVFKKMQHEFYQPNWFIFLFVTLLAGWTLGVVLGNLNYEHHMQPYFDYANLNEYSNVNPARMRGAQLMDAGKVSFVNETGLDLRRSMGFKNLDTYCVAPITVDGSPLASYDFWAVGINCCSGNVADFHCGQYNNPKAQGGLRFLHDEERAFFRLAVQQAEATYGIKATHPLFFHWVTDPAFEMQAYKDEAYKYLLIGMFVHFGWQLFVLSLAVMGFVKLGYY